MLLKQRENANKEPTSDSFHFLLLRVNIPPIITGIPVKTNSQNGSTAKNGVASPVIRQLPPIKTVNKKVNRMFVQDNESHSNNTGLC